MTGYNGSPNIWEPTKDYLRKELEKHTPGTTLHVIPFQGKTLPAFSFDANNLEWKKIEKQLEEHVKNVTNTNICDAWDKGIPVFGGIDNDLIIYANTHKLKKIHKIGFSAVGEYKAKALCNDPYFDVKVIDGIINGGILKVQIIAKQPISQIDAAISDEYNFTFDVLSEEITIVNPTVKVQMSNTPERSLDILSEEVSLGKATWYDSFLFWGESNQDTLSVDLKTYFNEEAIKASAAVHFQITDTEGNNDFQLLYNNQPIESNKIILRSEDKSPSILSVVFETSAKEGKRYFEIKPITNVALDNINEQPVEQYKLSLRSEYEVNWNPLKIIVMWLCIIMLRVNAGWYLLISL